MPTFAAAFDRLLETRSSTSVDKTFSSPMPVPSSRPPQPKPISTSKLERRNSTPSGERKIPQMTPSLYATPNPTPLPDSPSSLSPSPYVINHKRRGPRLVKSSTVPDVSSLEKTTDEPEGNGIGNNGEHSISTMDTVVRDKDDRMVEDNDVNSASVGPCSLESNNIGFGGGSSSSLEGYVGKAEFPKPNQLISERLGDKKDFFDLQESLSYTSNTEGEDNGNTDKFSSLPSAGEFFDAWEELSSESDHQPSSFRDIEKELREIRLSLLMEIEKRKQAEEALTITHSHWQRLRQELSTIGITLPALPIPNSESQQLVGNPVDDLCQQVALARFVSEAIGRGTAKAEMEAKMEEQIEAKNFEISRLIDRLHYYEAMNQEMSQRNQESVERSRRLRQARQRRQKWIWGSVAATFTLGSAALVWSYYSAGKGEHSSSESAAAE